MARVSATRFRCMYTESGRLCKPSRVHLPNVRCRKHLLVLPLRNHPAQEDRPDIRPCLGSGCTRSPSHTSCTPEAPCTPSPSLITARTRSDMKPPRSETCCCPAPSCPPQTSRPSSSSSARPEAHTPRPSTSPQSGSSRSSPSPSRSHSSLHGRTRRRICTLPHCSPRPAPPSSTNLGIPDSPPPPPPPHPPGTYSQDTPSTLPPPPVPSSTLACTRCSPDMIPKCTPPPSHTPCTPAPTHQTPHPPPQISPRTLSDNS